jgi:hypothetical protein
MWQYPDAMAATSQPVTDASHQNPQSRPTLILGALALVQTSKAVSLESFHAVQGVVTRRRNDHNAHVASLFRAIDLSQKKNRAHGMGRTF